MIVEVTGLRRLENGLVVSGKFMAFTKDAVIGQQLKEQILHIKQLCKHMARNNYTRYNRKETVLLHV